ncbi:hypothetical protein F5144DRAFT_586832 [Chaetomium tenue]|uniref:Uncharacterized protein n=1 Tax=Chaetomium tenue TaxID=1854479 RepID=A0ACB7NWE1_9PEZI|nr:hypothetical protein F5144DRAFT_586832 [Chaetomium globosum]
MYRNKCSRLLLLGTFSWLVPLSNLEEIRCAFTGVDMILSQVLSYCLCLASNGSSKPWKPLQVLIPNVSHSFRSSVFACQAILDVIYILNLSTSLSLTQL